MSTVCLILIFLAKSCLCQDMNKLFDDINKDYGKFNARAAAITWDSSVNPANDLKAKAAKYQEELITWQHGTCDELRNSYSRGLFNSTEERQFYLLCRGPRFTYDEARLSSTLYEKLQGIYSNSEVCIPSGENINKNDLEAAEAAILTYLTNVKKGSNYGLSDYVLYAAKLAVYREWNGDNAFCMGEEDEFQRMIVFSKAEEVLRWLWLVWREKVGTPMKEPYKKFIEIQNIAARRNGYPDIGSSWRQDLEIPDLRRYCRRLYENILPMYKMLHGVARFYLRKYYGNIVPERGAIPAHLLGDLWSQNWEPLAQLIHKKSIDLNHSMKLKNWTVLHMVKRAEDFYLSIGLPPMTETFWTESVFERQNDSIRCHGTAADMFKKGDFRMLYCMDVSMDDFYGLHHEMGHIQYYMAYEKQPAIFRQANAAFHEAIGDTIMLGVLTPLHLHRLGLINDKTLYTIGSEFIASNTSSAKLLNTRIIKYMRKKREIVYNNKINGVSNDTDRTYDEINTNKFDIYQMENHKCNNKPNSSCYYQEIIRSKRTKRSNGSYKMSEKRKKEQLLLDSTNSKEKKLTVFQNGNKKKESIISPDQNIYVNTYSDRDTTISHQRNDYKIENIVKESKHLGRDPFVIENIEEDVDDPLFNMKLDDILLFKQALNKIPQIPFALLIDEYRWKYFEGSLNDNSDFWRMGLELQGIAPPEYRGEDYFDVGAKFHVPDNTPYIRSNTSLPLAFFYSSALILGLPHYPKPEKYADNFDSRYFLSSFLQYQLFETLCKGAVFGRRNPDEPLPETISMSTCDIYGSKTVGKILLDFMSRGNSQHWRDILQQATGQRDISAAAIQRYYRPLFQLLTKLVHKYRIPIGW